MKTVYKVLIYVSVSLVLCISSFILGRITLPKDFDTNKLNEIKYKLEQQRKQNEELLEYVSDCESTIKDLQLDNDKLNSKLDVIKGYTSDTQDKLNSITNNLSTTFDYIATLKKNNDVLMDYYYKMEVESHE